MPNILATHSEVLTEFVMTIGVTYNVWDNKTEDNLLYLFLVSQIPMETRFLELQEPRLPQDEFNLGVVVVQSLSCFRKLVLVPGVSAFCSGWSTSLCV